MDVQLLRDMLKSCHELLATMELQPQPDHELVELMRATCRALEARLDGVEAA